MAIHRRGWVKKRYRREAGRCLSELPSAVYDSIADWYEDEFLAGRRARDPLGIDRALVRLLGRGRGPCVEIGCGTGFNARRIRELGWQPVGFDISAGMLRHARGRLPVAQADVTRLPLPGHSIAAAVAVMVHTDMPDYAPAVREVARVLRPGGVFVHVGVHPCFCGSFADRGDPEAVVIRPGYLTGRWTTDSWTDKGIRDKVGATHLPLPDLLHTFLDAGLTLDRFAEGGAVAPIMFAVRARRR